MKKITLKPKDINDWKKEQWNLYASEMFKGNLLRMWINHNGRFLVKYGSRPIYEGTQITHAIAAWDSV